MPSWPALIERLKQKETAFRVIDTHAGAGFYDLTGDEASRSGEWREGIGRLYERALDPPVAALIAPYLDAVRAANGGGPLRRYPGSPWIARHLLRRQDRLTLTELHPDDAKTLAGFFAGDRQVKVIALDGWLALGSFVPPKERRGLVLVDPPYEARDEFDRLVERFAEAHRRWPTGLYALWYPVKDLVAIDRLRLTLAASGIRRLLRAELSVRDRSTAGPFQRRGPRSLQSRPGSSNLRWRHCSPASARSWPTDPEPRFWSTRSAGNSRPSCLDPPAWPGHCLRAVFGEGIGDESAACRDPFPHRPRRFGGRERLSRPCQARLPPQLLERQLSPLCDQPEVLGRIAEKFAYADARILYTGLAIAGFERIRESTTKAGGPSLIDRRYCKARAIMTNGRKYAVVYLIESGQGFASIGWNVESCLPAFDPWRVYDAWCRSIHP